MVPAFLETDVLLDRPGAGGREEGEAVKTGAGRLRVGLKAREEER